MSPDYGQGGVFEVFMGIGLALSEILRRIRKKYASRLKISSSPSIDTFFINYAWNDKNPIYSGPRDKITFWVCIPVTKIIVQVFTFVDLIPLCSW